MHNGIHALFVLNWHFALEYKCLGITEIAFHIGPVIF